MKLEDILNYSPERTAVPLRKRALRWLAAFLAVMAVCTVLSRAADSLTVCRCNDTASGVRRGTAYRRNRRDA